MTSNNLIIMIGAYMIILKTIFVTVFAGFLFLIVRFADEYFRPYKRRD